MTRRGDLVIGAAPGDFGKPGPFLIVQSDLFARTGDSITLCPLTTELQVASTFRPTVTPSGLNGLRQTSQIMIDKLLTLHSRRVKDQIGKLDDDTMREVDAALMLFLGLVKPASSA